MKRKPSVYVLYLTVALLALAPGTPLDSRDAPLRQALRIPILLRVYEASFGEEFLDIVGSAIDREGRAIWIRERGEMLARRIDRRTGRVSVVGRLGDGPLEFRRIMSVAPHAQSGVLLFDVAQRRLTHVAVDGTPARVLGTLDSRYVGGISRLRADTLDRLFGSEQSVGWESTETDPWGSRPRQLFTDGTMQPVPLSLPPLQSRNAWRGSSPEGRPYTYTAEGPRWFHTILRDGRIASAWTDSGAVWITGRDGTVTRLSFPVVREPWTAQRLRYRADFLRNFEATIARERVTMRGPRPRPSATRPELDGLLERMDGGFVIGRTRDCKNVPGWRNLLTGAPPPPDQELCPVIEPFTARGVAEAPIVLPRVADGRILGMWGDTLWFALRYPDDPDLEGFYRIGEFVVRR